MSPVRVRANKRPLRRACFRQLGRRCPGTRRRGPARALDPAFPVSPDVQRNTRKARDVRRSAGQEPAPRNRSPAATSASHSQTPTGRLWRNLFRKGSLPTCSGNRYQISALDENPFDLFIDSTSALLTKLLLKGSPCPI